MTGAPARSLLVCGGAGYIGAHMCKRLARAGFEPVTLDNLVTGHREAVRWGPLLQADLLDPPSLAEAFAARRFEAVLHFAALSIVGESVAQPDRYLRNNVQGTQNLLEAMRVAGVDRLVFSSTAAVYGNPRYTPIDEAHPLEPINPYGTSKMLAERAIASACTDWGLRATCLRYFNAAGADREGDVGEAHSPETHLVPNLLLAALDPRRGPATLHGDDYDTADGTCVRDYVHVEDLCEAHLLALDGLASDAAGAFHAYNLGTGHGHSVAQVLAACRRHCDGRPESTMAGRRPGDPPVLVAPARAAATALGWRPERSLDDCIGDALAWHRSPRF
jgi:UDP-glucose-4-epimerase GalE